MISILSPNPCASRLNPALANTSSHVKSCRTGVSTSYSCQFFTGGHMLPQSSSSGKRRQSANQALPPVRAATGFGQKVAKTNPHKIRTLDLKKAGPTDRYKVFVRNSADMDKTWAPLAELWVEEGADAQAAIRERIKTLAEGVSEVMPSLAIRKADTVEYGVYKLVLPEGEGATEGEVPKQVEIKLEDVVLVDLKGDKTTDAVPALLRYEVTRKGPYIPAFAR